MGAMKQYLHDYEQATEEKDETESFIETLDKIDPLPDHPTEEQIEEQMIEAAIDAAEDPDQF